MDTAQEADAYPFPLACPFTQPPELARRRKEAPVAPVTLPGNASAWLVTRFDDVRTVLTDERFSRSPVRQNAVREQRRAEPASGPGQFDFGAGLADPAAHARWRSRLGSVLTPQHAESLRPRIGQIVDETLDEMAVRPDRTAEFVSDFAYRVPVRVLAGLFDLTPRLSDRLQGWATRLRGAAPSTAAFGEAMRSLYEVAAELVARERAEPGPGLIGLLLSADREGREGTGTMTDEELVSTVFLLATAGYESTAVQFANGLLALFQHPVELERLRSGSVSMAAAVEEILRYAQAGTGFAGTTYTTEEVRLGDVTLPPGATVLISLDSAGRDERRTDRPEVFAPSHGAPHHHLSFGAGGHYCLGASVARVELQEGFTRLLARFPGLRPSGDPWRTEFTRNLFHHYPRELRVEW
ncbi:cytochrome P450 [Streptomyces verrucosisporus]|uniref:cytochrome P450 n=1 Tax=Streptomyces verrucosisporus TaxID=1695161 RepID=UPI0019D28C13|nr:cytochrome P450 [Streptomyces verrucosisporus]MBN3932629.1 cytochrome P450 [Streptomyces verrucosisporus]